MPPAVVNFNDLSISGVEYHICLESANTSRDIIKVFLQNYCIRDLRSSFTNCAVFGHAYLVLMHSANFATQTASCAVNTMPESWCAIARVPSNGRVGSSLHDRNAP